MFGKLHADMMTTLRNESPFPEDVIKHFFKNVSNNRCQETYISLHFTYKIVKAQSSAMQWYRRIYF